ncbi:hypothetical protein [Neobacillus piezotolerans]|uniref:hypothetical protein n=1 Tax=Neobacillus piezotolerans TaxID=2259171 RepID=UPI0015F17159|nr:hypothetical protein [Neobacillus piezotolerans]
MERKARRLLVNATHFLRAWVISGMPFNVLREKLARGDPAGMGFAEEAPGLPAESEVPVA